MTKQSKMNSQSNTRESGVALIFCLFALLILAAVTASMIMLTGTETSVNYNYRTEEIAFFAAKSGIYEALDRMQQSNSATIASQIPTVPPSATGGVLYIINAGSSLTVQPWNPNNAYFDDEFCHEGYSITGMTATSPDVPCTTVPTGSTWYTTVTSNSPWSGTSTAMPYEWVRINWKQNSTQAYLSGGTTPVTSYYSVNSSGTSTTPACWNSTSEMLLSTPPGIPAYTSCLNYQSCGAIQPTLGTPVLMITALAVTTNGSRQMVQAEAALNPPAPFTVPPTCTFTDPYGFFAYGSTCPSSFVIGGNASTDGYNSGKGTYLATKKASLGSVGTNGGLTENGTSSNIGGTVYVPNIGSPPGPGSCPADFSLSGGGTYGGLAASTVMPTPNVTVPAPGSTLESYGKSGGSLPPGSYGDILVNSGGTLTLTGPGTYNINCLDVGSNRSNITISPAGQAVTINVTGNPDANCTNGPIFFAGNAFINNPSAPVASTLLFNYGGTATLTFTGGTATSAVVNAPRAAVVLHGGADFYGTIVANTIDDSGGTNLHFDSADTALPQGFSSTITASATGSYNTLAFHSLSY